MVKLTKLITEMTKAEADEVVARQVLDEEELEIEAAFARGEYVSVPDLPARVKELQAAVKNTLRKKPVTIRIQERDIRSLKVKALEEGIPYQTLMSSIVHKYLTGRLVERN